MLSKCFKLSKNSRMKKEHFNLVFNNSRYFYSDSFKTFSVNHKGSYPKLGITIAKRYMKSAVQRNFLKRQIRELFRRSKHKLSGLNIVVMLKKPANLNENDPRAKKCLQENLKKHWHKLIKHLQKYLLS